MKLAHHQGLTVEYWNTISFAKQLLNVGSEISRARNAKRIGDMNQEKRAYERALELIDLTIETVHNTAQLREIQLLREAIASLMIKSDFNISLDALYRYLLQFSALK